MATERPDLGGRTLLVCPGHSQDRQPPARLRGEAGSTSAGEDLKLQNMIDRALATLPINEKAPQANRPKKKKKKRETGGKKNKREQKSVALPSPSL